jgi:protein-disulfide isomerase
MSSSNRERLRAEQAAKAKQAKVMRIVGVAAIAVAVLVLGVFGTLVVQTLGKSGQITPPNATADKAGIVAYPGTVVATANPTASSTATPGVPVVELFYDYQCPVCKQLETLHGATLAELAKSGKIDLRYRPLIFLDSMLSNDSSQRATIAATCADLSGHFAAYHDTIFANQPAEGVGYTRDQLRTTFAQTAGITGTDLTTFQACYDQQQTRDFVKAADALNVPQSTPRMTVNGKDFDFRISADQLAAAIAKAAS